jgi:hypothetical protein
MPTCEWYKKKHQKAELPRTTCYKKKLLLQQKKVALQEMMH